MIKIDKLDYSLTQRFLFSVFLFYRLRVLGHGVLIMSLLWLKAQDVVWSECRKE